jgi:2'-5' RNA ligase
MKTKQLRHLIHFLTLLLGLVTQSHAEQRLDMEGAAIFGNKESPNVLYVVPWRQAKRLTGMMAPEMNTMEELLVPLDRDVFRRHMDWHQTFGEKP